MDYDPDAQKDSGYLRDQLRLQAITLAFFLAVAELRGAVLVAVLVAGQAVWMRMYRRFDVIGLPVLVGGVAALVRGHPAFGLIGIAVGLLLAVVAWQTRLPRKRKFT
jgi:hypothetical protein